MFSPVIVLVDVRGTACGSWNDSEAIFTLGQAIWSDSRTELMIRRVLDGSDPPRFVRMQIVVGDHPLPIRLAVVPVEDAAAVGVAFPLDRRWNDLGCHEHYQDICGQVGDGLPVKSIARQLGLEPSTVYSHIRAIKAKLGLRNNAELVKWCTENARPD